MLLTALLALAIPQAEPLTTQQLADLARPSVLYLSNRNAAGTERSSGTGFIVSADGKVVTNHHVIQHAGSMVARTHDGTEVEVEGILAADEENDVAVLKLAGNGHAALRLGNSTTLVVGDAVAVVGSPMGLSQTVSTGIVSAVRQEGLNDKKAHARKDGQPTSWKIQVTAPLTHGSSGSPLLTMDGQVVGVAVGIMDVGAALGFCVPIEVARTMINALPPDARPTPFGTSGWNNLAISAAFFLAVMLAWMVGMRWPRLWAAFKARSARP